MYRVLRPKFGHKRYAVTRKTSRQFYCQYADTATQLPANNYQHRLLEDFSVWPTTSNLADRFAPPRNASLRRNGAFKHIHQLSYVKYFQTLAFATPN